MSHSLYGADRTTHLKIIGIALIGACLVAGVGIAARDAGRDGSLQARVPVIKAGAPVAVSSSELQTIR